MSNDHRPGADGANVRIQWYDGLTGTRLDASILGAILRVHIDLDGTVCISGIEAVVPYECRTLGDAAPTRSVKIELSALALEELCAESSKALKVWKRNCIPRKK